MPFLIVFFNNSNSNANIINNKITGLNNNSAAIYLIYNNYTNNPIIMGNILDDGTPTKQKGCWYL